MNKKFFIFHLVLFYFTSVFAATTSELEQRIEQLEKQQAEMFQSVNEEKNRVKPFLQNEILLGGYFETATANLDGPKMDNQTTAGSHLLGLNLAARMTEKDRFVGQLQTGLGFTFANRHSDPRVTATPTRQSTTSVAPTILAHAYYEHHFERALNMQLGLGYVPFGIAYHNREPLLFRRRGGDAQMVNQSATQDGGVTSVGVAFPLWMGVHLHGTFPLAANQWGYHLYTFSPTTNPKSIGEGGRLWWQLADGVTIGSSIQTGDHKRYTYNSYGADIDFKYENYGLTMEYAEVQFQGGPYDPPMSYYVTPYVELADGKFVVYAIVDYLDNPTNVTQTTGFPADPYERMDIGGGVNYLPSSNIRFRLGYTQNTYMGQGTIIKPQDRSYSVLDFSLVAAF